MVNKLQEGEYKPYVDSDGYRSAGLETDMSNNDDSEVEGGKNLTRTEVQEAKQQGRETL